MRYACAVGWSLSLFIAVPVLAGDNLSSYLQKQALRTIAACKSERCVNEVVESLDYDDAAIRIIRAAKLDELHAPSAETALLDAIPADPVSFWFAYTVTGPRLEGFGTVNELYSGYFHAAAKAVATSGTKVRDFLLLQHFADGEMAALIAEEIDYVAKENRDAYCAARRTLSTSVQRQLNVCKSQ